MEGPTQYVDPALLHAYMRRDQAALDANERRARERYFLGLAQRNAPVVGADIRQIVQNAVRPRERRDVSGRSSARSGDSPDDGPSSSEARLPDGGAA